MYLEEGFKNLVDVRSRRLELEFEIVCEELMSIFSRDPRRNYVPIWNIISDKLVMGDEDEHIDKSEIPMICFKYADDLDTFIKDFSEFISFNPYFEILKPKGRVYKYCASLITRRSLKERTKMLNEKRKNMLCSEFDKVCQVLIEIFVKYTEYSTLYLSFTEDGINIDKVYERIKWNEIPIIAESYKKEVSKFATDFGDYAYSNADLFTDFNGVLVKVSLEDS